MSRGLWRITNRQDFTPEQRSLARKGIKDSLETKAKKSAAKMGKKLGPMKEETKQKLSLINKALRAANPERYLHTQQTKDKIGAAHRGKIVRPETLRKMSEYRKTFRHKEETKQKISQALKGRILAPRQIVICPHCPKQGNISTMKRWHFDACKFKG